MEKNDSTKKKAGFRSLIGMLSFLGRYPGRVAACISLLLVNISIEMALPQIIGNAITNLRWHMEWGAEFPRLKYVALFLTLVLIRTTIGHVLGPTRNRLVQRTLNDIRNSIYDAMQRLSFSFHDKTSSGELISRSTTDVWRLQEFFFASLLMAIDITVALIATIALIGIISPRLAVVTVATVIPTALLLGYYARKLQPQWRKVHDLHGEMTTVVQENIAGVRVVKAFAKESAEIEKFTKKRDVYLETMLRTVNYWSTRVPVAQFLFGLTLPLGLWQGGTPVIRGELLLGDLVKVIFYLLAIGNRMGAIGQFTNIVQNASASAERVLEIIQDPERLKSGHKPLPPGGGAIEFQNV